MPPRGKFEICVESYPGFYSFINCHDISHTSLWKLIFIEDLPGSHCDGFYHNNDDDVEGICFDECRKQVGTGDDEVKRENAQPDPVSTTASWV